MKMRPNKNVPVSKATRVAYGIAFVFGLVLLGTGVALYSPGADLATQPMEQNPPNERPGT